MSPYLFEIYTEMFMDKMMHLGLVSKWRAVGWGIDETRLAKNLGFGWSNRVHGGTISEIGNQREKQVLIGTRGVADQEFCF